MKQIFLNLKFFGLITFSSILFSNSGCSGEALDTCNSSLGADEIVNTWIEHEVIDYEFNNLVLSSETSLINIAKGYNPDIEGSVMYSFFIDREGEYTVVEYDCQGNKLSELQEGSHLESLGDDFIINMTWYIPGINNL